MRPTLDDGDIIVGERLSVKMHNLHIGDIVCAKTPYSLNLNGHKFEVNLHFISTKKGKTMVSKRYTYSRSI